MRELSYLAETWGLPLVTGLQDIQTAFDSMPHELIGSSMLASGAHPHLVGLHMQELTGMQAYINLPGAGPTSTFDFWRGGKQGGVETPDERRILVQHVLEPVVQRWHKTCVGFRLPDEDDAWLVVSHAIWADNIILFASGFGMLQSMITDVNEAFGQFKTGSGTRHLLWKPTSLEVIVSGSLRGKRAPSFDFQQESGVCN